MVSNQVADMYRLILINSTKNKIHKVERVGQEVWVHVKSHVLYPGDYIPDTAFDQVIKLGSGEDSNIVFFKEVSQIK